MKRCQFNFNNEVDTFEIHVEDDGRVTVPGENGQVMAEYDSVQQLAEIYAQARDVKPENLKNWTLLQNGNVFSYVLRAGTAGLDVSEAEEQLEGIFDSLSGRHHALSIARAKEQIMADGTADLVQALVHCTETDVARDVYDAMGAAIAGTEVAVVETPAEEADTRTALEKYIDEMDEVPGALGFIATLVGLPAGTAKEEVAAACAASFAFSNVDSLNAVYNNAVNDAMTEGIGVATVADALTVITQTAVGTGADDDMKNRLIAATRMAGRKAVNVSVDVVGTTHIRHTAELVPVEELAGTDLFVRENVPYIVRFDEAVDAELEAEREAQREDQADEDTDQEEYEEGYDEDYGEEED